MSMDPLPGENWEWVRRPGMVGHHKRSCCGATDDEREHKLDCHWWKSKTEEQTLPLSSKDVESVLGTRYYAHHLVTEHPARSKQANRIVRSDGVLAEALDHFLMRNRGYGDGANNLGVRGQYADLNRKMLKLKRYIWDLEPVEPGEESVQIIVKELIGHCLLMLDEMERNKDES